MLVKEENENNKGCDFWLDTLKPKNSDRKTLPSRKSPIHSRISSLVLWIGLSLLRTLERETYINLPVLILHCR